ncbi:hypothetical protein BDZ94DRAFT_1325916 [Collybia nuda]|uniref:Septin-type G domain-containing protein n=1 Tax=Collybia nuda TaxID=64659 RepID=A0A9P5XYD2_9AGAR|nr:hypothetical protein BDZ94DRAFT_1325916 [Collybia nuda]
MEENISTSASTIRLLHHHLPEFPPLPRIAGSGVSVPSSPRSSTLPSPPDSPSSESVSSLPSVSSSFFFSSAAASPGPSQPQSRHEPDHARESAVAQGLIIPSLMLPEAVGRPTPYGQTVGDVRLLVLGSKGVGRAFVTGLLLEDNEDVVDVGTWEDVECGRLLRASTDWVEHRDAHGLERFEPTRNVEILDLPGYDHDTDVNGFLQAVKSIIQVPFYTVSDVLDPAHRPSAIVANLVSSTTTPLYTALIFLLPSAPTPLDSLIIDTLSTHIPTILLPRIPHHHQTKLPFHTNSKLSSFRPSSVLALRAGLFHSPETIAVLRSEATDRFLRWREVERAVDEIHMARRDDATNTGSGSGSGPGNGPEDARWDKGRWEAEWVAGLSHDVARRLREGTLTERNVRRAQNRLRQVLGESDLDGTCASAGDHDPESCNGGEGYDYDSTFDYDPLHLPSLVLFSISLLGPLRVRLGRTVVRVVDKLGEASVQVALVGGFCVGVGVGVYLKSAQHCP